MSFGNQQADFLRDVPEAPAQAVMTRLKLLSGEWYLDNSQGVPYQGGVLGYHTAETADPIIRDQILNTQAVTGITNYSDSLNPDTRQKSVVAEIDTLYGPVVVQGVV